MLSDIEKLVKYQDEVNELLKLRRELGEQYDELDTRFPAQMLITENWIDKDTNESKTYKFRFSRIDGIREKLRKKIEYRKRKLKEKQKHEAKE